ncbi:MAG TPA: hypothetical protein VK178_17445 [Opitutaceae bacterium]|nr:hypothetical protein [Opitutaceae bacterium]
MSAAVRLGRSQAARWSRTVCEAVRPLVAPADWRREWAEGGPAPRAWAIDFPPGADDRDIVAAGEPGRRFARSGARIPRTGAGAELRIALAKCDRFLATPAGGRAPRWRWVPATMLPCGGLVVVARDDEFLAGVLASRWFDAWWRGGVGGRLDVAAVRDFPLPWPVDLPRGAFTREQEERRDAVVRAWRGGTGGAVDFDSVGYAGDALAGAVAAAYGWPAEIEVDDALARLRLRACLSPSA